MLTHPSPVPPPIKKQRATSTPMKYPVQPPPQQQRIAQAPSSGSSISSRRAALHAMQQRLSAPAPHTTNSGNIIAMARSQLEPPRPTSTSTPLSSITNQSRSSSTGSLQRQQHQFSYNAQMRPLVQPRPMSSIMIDKKESNDDDSLLVTPPDYQPSVQSTSSKKSNGSYKSSPPPPPTPRELQKHYSKSVSTPSSSFSTTSSRPSTSNNTNTLRLIQKLVQVTEEKTAAVQKINTLQQELFEYQQQTKTAEKIDPMKCMMHGAGMMKLIALREKIQHRRANAYFNQWKDKTLNRSPSPPPILSVPAHQSFTQPSFTQSFTQQYPSSSSIKSTQTTPPISTKYLIEALNTVSLDYSSNLADYTIRSPYKPTTMTKTTITSMDEYLQSASVLHPSTIELYIQVSSDITSKFILHSNDSLYNLSTNSNEIHPLGKVLYITTMGIEDEYNLYDVYNEALIVRDNYCTNLKTAAYALQRSYENATVSTKDLRGSYNDDDSTIATKDTFHNDLKQYDVEKRDASIQTDVIKEPQKNHSNHPPPTLVNQLPQ